MAKLHRGMIVEYSYGAEYEGPNRWKIMRKDHQFLGDVPRYTISNGVSEVSGVRAKFLKRPTK